jgi:hypothetical protein
MSLIRFEVADDLSYWSAEIHGKVLAKAESFWTYDSNRQKSTNT